jgi:hypothetical protein
MSDACDRLWEVDALREGRLSDADATAHRRHAAGCRICRERLASDERLAALGRELEAPASNPLRARRIRAQILRHAAAPSPTSRAPALAVAAVAAAALTVAVGLSVRRASHVTPPVVASAPPAADAGTVFAGEVTAMPGARWTQAREESPGAVVERVRLSDGTIAVHVRKQAPGERFLVVAPDGEVEVRGTTFEVTAREGATTSVHVEEGLVAFRRPGAADVVLAAGQTWHPTPPRLAGTPSVRTGPSSSPRADRDTSEYERAVAAYEARDYAAAARRCAAFVAVHPDAPEAEDATFLEASALAHDGRTPAAAAAAERFLARFGEASFHGRDAAILVARAARDRGDCQRARDVLARWTSASPSPDIASALGPCSP